MLTKTPQFTKGFSGLLFRLLAFYATVFLFLRILFCLVNLPADANEPISSYVFAFVMGLRFDLIIVSYLLMPALLFFYLHESFFPANTKILKSVKYYFYVINILVFFIASADIPYFTQFGSHINKSVMVWRLNMGYTIRLIFSSFVYWAFLVLFLFLVYLANRFVKSFVDRYAGDLLEKREGKRARLAIIFLIFALLFIGLARGRLSRKSTMHEGMAIVSKNAFVNQIGLNSIFTLIKSLERKDENTEYLKNIDADLQACKILLPHRDFNAPGVNDLINSNVESDTNKKYNVIIVLMESLSMAKLGYYSTRDRSPFLNELKDSSLFFDRFFSSGIHTFNGLFSTATGFPSIYTEQGLRQYTGKPFITLANLLKPRGYKTYFCLTHDPVFDNIEGFFTLNGFDEFISDNDFDNSASLGITGIPDHLLYLKLVEKISANKNTQPFISMILSGTDHGPWVYPNNIDFKPSGSDEKENASQYADWSVKQFLKAAKKQKWYDNTIFVILGDHGQIIDDPYEMPITYNHIPLIIHCPALLKPGLNHNLGVQHDIVKTISSLLGVGYTNHGFGIDLLNEKRNFVSFSADDKLGFVTDDDYFFYHILNTGQKKLVKFKNKDTKDYYPTRKKWADSLYMQNMAIYNSAQYYLRKNYFNF